MKSKKNFNREMLTEVVNHESLINISQKYNISKVDILQEVKAYSKVTQNPKLSKALIRIYNTELIKEYVAQKHMLTDKFVSIYNIKKPEFIKLVLETLNTNVNSQTADIIFKRLLEDCSISSSRYPEIIVRNISNIYAHTQLSMEQISKHYGVHPSTISKVILRGISCDMIDNETVELVLDKVSHICHPYRCPGYIINLYYDAIDKRLSAQKNKENQ